MLNFPLTEEEDEKLKNYIQPKDNTEQKIDERIADSNPGHKPEDLMNYVKGQEAQIDKYGPTQEKAVMDSIVKSRGSLGNRLARGGAGLGDAIMGVAGKQGPGFLNSLESRQAKEETQDLNSISALRSANKEVMGEKQRLEGMDSSTALGGSQVAPLIEFFKKAGVPEDKIPAMVQNPAAARGVVEAFATMMTAEQKMQMETMLRQLELGLRGRQLKTQEDKDSTQAKLDADKAKLEKDKFRQDALRDVAKTPFWKSFGPSYNAQRRDAGLDQDETSDHGIPDLGSTFNGHKVVGVKRIK